MDDMIKKTTGMKASSVEDLTSDFKRFGIQHRKQVGKEVISHGGPWVSIVFVYLEKDESGELNTPRIMLANFKSSDGMYNRNSYFIVKDKEQAKKICDILMGTFLIGGKNEEEE